MSYSNPDIHSQMGQLLLSLRIRAGRSQTQLAEVFGFKRPDAISNWEKGENFPQAKNVQKLIEFYLCDCEQVFVAGNEAVEAESLWSSVKRVSEAKGRIYPNFDKNWFNGLLSKEKSPEILPNTENDIASKFPIFQVPHRRNPNFTGREDILDELVQALKGGSPSAITQTIAGLGGIGKTQIAIEYAYRHKKDFSLVWWLQADSETNLKSGLAALAVRLGLTVPQDPEQTVKDTLRWLEENEGWLLVYDNADEPKFIPALLPKSGGQIIITSRRTAWTGIAQPLSVAVWDKARAVEFLEKRSHRTNRNELEKLAEVLGYLPLALEHAAAFLDQIKVVSIPEYLENFDLDLLEEGELSQDHHKDTIRTTWQISLEKLPPEAAQLLNLFACFAPDNIPLDIIPANADELPENLAAYLKKNKLNLGRAIGALQSYSLVELSEDKTFLSVHRLLQAVIRDGFSPETEKLWVSTALRLINSVFPDDSDDYHYWPLCTQLLPHAQGVTFAAGKLEVEQKSAARLANQTGLYFRAIGDYVSARACYEHACAMDEMLFGFDHPELAIDYNNLGLLLKDQGDLAGARNYLECALVISKKILPEDHPDLANNYNSLGSLVYAQGDLVGAKNYFELAIAIFEKILPADHINLSILNNNLSQVLQSQGNLTEAKNYLERALVISKKILPEDHPDLATPYSNLGSLLQDRGELEEARNYFELAASIDEKVLGLDHPTLAIDYNNLGGLMQAQGNLVGAKTYFERALVILRAKLDDNHPTTRIVQKNLAILEEEMIEQGQ